MAALTGLYISQSYGGLIQLSTNTGIVAGTNTQLQDGLGTNLGVWVNGQGSVSGSSFTGSLFGTASFAISSSNAASASYATYSSIGGKYTLVANITGGALNTLDPVNSFTGPTGEDLIAAGWNVITSSASSVIVSRPSTNNSLPVTYFSSLVWNTATNVLATRVITNVGAANIQQSFSGTTYPSFSVNGITSGNYGFAASSDVPLYLVFTI